MVFYPFAEDIDFIDSLRRRLSTRLPKFQPGDLVKINPECQDNHQLKSLLLYIEIEDVNLGINTNIKAPNYFNAKKDCPPFHERAFLFLYEHQVLFGSYQYESDVISVANVFDIDKKLNIPLYMLIKV